MICYYTYRGKTSNYVHSSFVDLGKDFHLPDDVFEYADAELNVKETVKQLVEIELAKQSDCVLVEICEFDDDEEEEE